MAAVRIVGLCALTLGLIVLCSDPGSAQIPGVKVSPQIKPPSSGPVTGPTGTPVSGGTAPGTGTPGTGTGSTPGLVQPGTGTGASKGVQPGGGGAGAPQRDPGNWPKEINGKTLDDCVREMRQNPDPAIRESAVRTLPLFGPVSRDKGADHLIYALTKDPDFNVRMTALGVAPTVLFTWALAQDQFLKDGLTAFMTYMGDSERHVRYEAILAVTAVGPYMKTEKPDVITKLTARAHETGSWQLRRAAVIAIGTIGQGSPPVNGAAKGIDPDQAAVRALLEVMKTDNSALVRRTAIDALIAVGPVGQAQFNEWQKSLENVFKVGAEKEKINLLWVHALLVRNTPNGPKVHADHLNAVADGLKADDKQMRIEACQALAMLGDDAAGKLQGLLDLIQDQKQDPAVVASAMMAAATMKSQAAITQPVLQAAVINHPNEDVRKVAGNALNELAKK